MPPDTRPHSERAFSFDWGSELNHRGERKHYKSGLGRLVLKSTISLKQTNDMGEGCPPPGLGLEKKGEHKSTSEEALQK